MPADPSPGGPPPGFTDWNVSATDPHELILHSAGGTTLPSELLARVVLATSPAPEGEYLASLDAVLIAAPPPEVPLDLSLQADTNPHGGRVVVADVSRRAEALAHVTLRLQSAPPNRELRGVRVGSVLPPADALPSTVARATKEGWSEFAGGPIEFRRAGEAWPWPPEPGTVPSILYEWVKPRIALPQDPVLHSAALAYECALYTPWLAGGRPISVFPGRLYRVTRISIRVHRWERWTGWRLNKITGEYRADGHVRFDKETHSSAGELLHSITEEGLYVGGANH